MMMRLAPLFLAVLVVLAAAPALAHGTFDTNVRAAYADYRAALFANNKGDKAKALKALAAFRTKWHKVMAEFPKPTPRYAEEKAWGRTLKAVANMARKGEQLAIFGRLADSHEVLEGIRDALGELRTRNHVVDFSDHVNAYHKQMEHLLSAGHTAESLDAKALNGVRETVGVLAYLADQIGAHASARLAGKAQFKTLLAGLKKSVADLRVALDSADTAAVAEAIQALKPAYAKLFVTFG